MEPNRDKSSGQTVPVQGEEQERAPRMPHERDESADSQARAEASQQRVGKAAHDSIERGQTDTDRGPVLDATYERLRKSSPQPEKIKRR